MVSASSWQLPAEPLCLEAETVHVWRIALQQPEVVVAEVEAILSADELVRANRFTSSAHRARFITGRAALRQILSRYLGVTPADIAFRYGERDKPAIAVPETDLQFNLAHSGDVALFAVTRGHELGVDIERERPLADETALIRRFFSPTEQAAFLKVPATERINAFFLGWTRKEAYIKALGDGLAMPLDSFAVTLTPGHPAALEWDAGDPAAVSRWRIVDLPCEPGYAAALAASSEVQRVALWQCQLDPPT